MKDFQIINQPCEEYNAIIILATQDSPLSILEDFQIVANELKINGKILIDQIYRVGNTEDRFISFEIKTTINKDSIKFEHIEQSSAIRKLNCNYLKQYNLIDSSVLTNIQKKMINKGISI